MHSVSEVMATATARDGRHVALRYVIAGDDGSDRIVILATDVDGQILAHAVFSDGFDALHTAAVGEVEIDFPTSAWRLMASRLQRPRALP